MNEYDFDANDACLAAELAACIERGDADILFSIKEQGIIVHALREFASKVIVLPGRESAEELRWDVC